MASPILLPPNSQNLRVRVSVEDRVRVEDGVRVEDRVRVRVTANRVSVRVRLNVPFCYPLAHRTLRLGSGLVLLSKLELGLLLVKANATKT
jgi:predicted subunit of tRNA(5-methylaminomethyl-2-thiouridylate) methyltransferase